MKNLLVQSAIITAFWPFIVLIIPEFLQPQTEKKIDSSQAKLDSTLSDLSLVSAADLSALSNEERLDLMNVRRAGKSDITFFSNFTDFEDVLRYLWDYGVPPEAYNAVHTAKSKLERDLAPIYTNDYEAQLAEKSSIDDDYDHPVLFSRRGPDWYIGFSTEVVKSISKLDKNKRARLLEAISYLATEPLTPYGDTVKPLTGEMAGLWRYRLGDDRLIYKPNTESKQITLVSFGARGDIY
ncbi:MAG: type II toxin-antitoxin system RelE family toxin [Polaromonas sp.]